MATNQPAAVSNLLLQSTGISVKAGNTNDPVEKELDQILEQDDAAQAEVDKWIAENDAFAAKGAGLPKEEMRRRIEERLAPVDKAYQGFIQRHPANSRARVAYASFLGDTKGEEAAEEQLDKALAVDTNNPAIYNNLANIYGHHGPVKKAFEYYAKALELNPQEPVYYHNLGTTVFLFRSDAKEYYGIDEQQVFNKAFGYYSNAMRLDPENFPLASDVAQTYYGVHPFRPEDARRAWTNALSLAHDEVEREGVYIHFARVNVMDHRFNEARAMLNNVTNELYADLKKRVARSIEDREKSATETNAAPAAASTTVPAAPANPAASTSSTSAANSATKP
jgi:tetratricopeptide (TPR) repeat protein